MSSKELQIDSLDRGILKLMQECNRTTSDQISEIVGLSPAAVQRRLKRLRELKIIKSDVSVIDSKTIGLPLTIVAQVELECERIDLVDGFKKKMKSNPYVQQCYYVTGGADFILVISARSMEDYNEFTQKTFFNNGNIKGFTTNVVMDPVKVGLSIPLDED